METPSFLHQRSERRSPNPSRCEISKQKEPYNHNCPRQQYSKDSWTRRKITDPLQTHEHCHQRVGKKSTEDGSQKAAQQGNHSKTQGKRASKLHGRKSQCTVNA